MKPPVTLPVEEKIEKISLSLRERLRKETEDKIEDEEIKTDVFPIFSTKSNSSRGDYSVKEELDCKGTGVVCHAPSGHKLQKDGCKFT